MSGRTTFILVMALAVALASGGGGTGAVAATRTSQCKSSGRTVAANSSVRLFRRGSHVYVCRLPHGKARAIAATLDQVGGPSGFRIAGTRVAFSTMYCGKASCTTRVQMVDAKTGRWTMLSQPSTTRGIPGLVLTADGALAWIRRVLPSGTPAPPATFEVVLRDRAGERVIASGADVNETSLALAGRRVYWTQGSTAASALLAS
jgi:hypothetical protein